MDEGSSPSRKRLRVSPESKDKKIFSNDFGGLFESIDFNIAAADNQQDQVTRQTVKCKCKSSKCLKLYCDCFASGSLCGVDCNCENCQNTASNTAGVQKARDIILKRNPVAFDKKIVHGNMHSRGCKCKSSKCMKRYCECFQAGVQCTSQCSCIDCQNGGDGVFKVANSNHDAFEQFLTGVL
tara:strand:- start:10764 stop:11309 length:546 start_codon:yes stop_codon:yes gene_type:complete